MTLTITSADKPAEPGELIPKFLEFMSKDQDRMARVLAHAQAAAIATTTTNDTGEVIDLIDEGIVFKDDHFYQVILEHHAASDNDYYYESTRQFIKGRNTAGGDPVLCSDVQLLDSWGIINGTVSAYGLVKAQATYAGDTATAVAANTSSGCSVGDNTTNTVTFTHPIARSSPLRYWVNACPDVATASEQLHAAIVAASSTTASIFLADLATPTADGFDDVGTLTAYGDIRVPTACFLSINGTPDPGAVEVHVTGISSDTLYHDVRVYVTEGIYVPATSGTED